MGSTELIEIGIKGLVSLQVYDDTPMYNSLGLLLGFTNIFSGEIATFDKENVGARGLVLDRVCGKYKHRAIFV